MPAALPGAGGCRDAWCGEPLSLRRFFHSMSASLLLSAASTLKGLRPEASLSQTCTLRPLLASSPKARTAARSPPRLKRASRRSSRFMADSGGTAGAAAEAPPALPPADEVDPALVKLALQHYPRIILGTSSSSRRGILDELCQEWGFTYEVAKADIDEKAIRHEDAHHLVLRLAHAKAVAIAAKLEAADGPAARSGLLITADQVVLHEEQILEKPEDEAQAREYIAGYARAPASTIGSVVVTDLATGRSWEGVDVAEIHFQAIPPASVDKLIAEGDVFWCAGGLLVEHELVQPHVTKMVGSLDSVMGLDKRLLLRLLSAAGAAAAAAEGEAAG